MKRCICKAVLIGMVGFLPLELSAQSDGQISGKVGNYTSYFLDNRDNFVDPETKTGSGEKVRHHRYELYLRYDYSFSFRLKSVISTRLRYDAALMDNERAPQRNLSEHVRKDEMAEAEVREAYLDYLGDSYRLVAGLQQIDWVESLSPLANDSLTAFDLRHGSFGAPRDVLEPIGAVVINHKLFGGTLEWMAVPLPKVHRLPEGNNGYGIREEVNDRLAQLQEVADAQTESERGRGKAWEVGVEDKGFDSSPSNAEFGVRYLTEFDGVELSLFGHKGNQRRPVLLIEKADEVEKVIPVVFEHPKSTTYGFFTTAAGESGWVLRFMGIYEPSRTPDLRNQNTDVDDIDNTESRTRVGVGFDFVFSKHLKLYSEHFRIESKLNDEGADSLGLLEKAEQECALVKAQGDECNAAEAPSESEINFYDENPRVSWLSVVRLANESFENAEFLLDAIITNPKKSHIIVPQMKVSIYNNMSFNFGGRFIRAYDESSPYYVLRNSSHIFSSLYYSF